MNSTTLPLIKTKSNEDLFYSPIKYAAYFMICSEKKIKRETACIHKSQKEMRKLICFLIAHFEEARLSFASPEEMPVGETSFTASN